MKEATRNTLTAVWNWIFYVILPVAIAPYVIGDVLFNGIAANVWILFVILAAILNSIMDSIENEHIINTRFYNLNPDFWSKRESWDKAYKIFGYKFDAWHLSKSAMIICIAFAIIFYAPINGFWWDFLLIGIVWNHTFNAFYNLVFKTNG